MGRLCLECRHCSVSMGDEGYSSWTPGMPAEFACLKPDSETGEGWSAGTSADQRELASLVRRAETCPSYEPEEWVGEDGC